MRKIEEIRFRGKFRAYQEQVLAKMPKALEDNKYHIVAAPGSGKTVLGLELIRRMGKKALCLSPSITIREQWVERFGEHFLPEGKELSKYATREVKETSFMISMTYQALYAAMDKDEAGFLLTLHNLGIETLCFDEAHHLKNEWWRALERLVAVFPEATRISLTATPPYDATEQEWERYIALCGEIDTEIHIPELVKEHSLCPHRDFIYINVPTKEEEQRIRAEQEDVNQLMEEILRKEEFHLAIVNHKGLVNLEEYGEMFLEHPKYFTAILSYLRACKDEIPKEVKHFLGQRANPPKMSVEWFEELLAGFLFFDEASYPCGALKEAIKKRLHETHYLRGVKFYFTKEKMINKTLASSLGKLQSILTITRAEQSALQQGQRTLILTDYIRKEEQAILGNEDKNIALLGAIPIFELLRRDGQQEIALLTGSVIFLSRSVILELDKTEVYGTIGKVSNWICGGAYGQISITDATRKEATQIVTKLFGEGKIKVLVGTVALLGEGWDAPCINSLIIASVVNSFVTSNQVRGRAIRMNAMDPNKVANIWNLMSATPVGGTRQRYRMGEEFKEIGQRFHAFMGLTQSGDAIENGIERLDLEEREYTGEEIKAKNEEMLTLAYHREKTKEDWERAITSYADLSKVSDEITLSKKRVFKNFAYYNSLAACIMGALTVVFLLIDRIIIPILQRTYTVNAYSAVCYVILFLASYITSHYGYRILRYLTPQGRFEDMASGVLQALRELGAITSTNIILVTDEEEYQLTAALEGASLMENQIFAKAMAQLYGVIENPRYLLMERRGFVRYEYYTVPDVFGKRKEDAVTFQKALNKHVKGFELVYTRTPKGRKDLLKARVNGYGNKLKYHITHKRIVLSKWE